MYSRAAQAYKKVSVESASPNRVLDELFSRVRLDFRLAGEAYDNNDVVGRCAALSEALQLVGALEAGLDTTMAPELCANLQALYRYVSGEILAANLGAGKAAIARADEVIAEVHDAFRSADSAAVAA